MANAASTLQTRPRPDWLKPWLRGETWAAFLFILPSLIGFTLFYAVPAVRGLLISFTDWDLLTPAEPVGLGNYQRLIGDREFWHALWVTLVYVVINVSTQTVFGLTIAVFMDRLTRSVLVRGIMILPFLFSNVVVGLIWLWILDPSLGIANELLKAVGLPRQPFLGSPDQAITTIAGINIWRHMGYMALLFLAGLQSIPKDVYEAAAIDGAGEVRSFWHITLPLLRPVLVFVLVTTIIGAFQIFDTIAITTEGGPIDSTRVIMWHIYEYAFQRFNMGYATTISMALFVLLIFLTLLQLRWFRAGESDL